MNSNVLMKALNDTVVPSRFAACARASKRRERISLPQSALAGAATSSNSSRSSFRLYTERSILGKVCGPQ